MRQQRPFDDDGGVLTAAHVFLGRSRIFLWRAWWSI
jgi:hypothetical protein